MVKKTKKKKSTTTKSKPQLSSSQVQATADDTLGVIQSNMQQATATLTPSKEKLPPLENSSYILRDLGKVAFFFVIVVALYGAVYYSMYFTELPSKLGL